MIRLKRKAGTPLVLIALAMTLPAAGQAEAPASDDPGTIVSKQLHQSPAEVRDYWTPKRMREAAPADLRITPPSNGPLAAVPSELGGDPKLVLPAAPGVPDSRAGLLDGLIGGADPQPRAAQNVSGDSSDFPERVHGKVFFTISDGSKPGDYVCSGTVVRSRSHTLVWTAGHCVHDLYEFGGGYATNFEFVPGYNNGNRPFGTYVAGELLTTSGFINGGDERFDVGAAIINRVGNGRGIQDVVGARGIAFNQPRNQPYSAFGYPRESPFNGQLLYRCDSNYLGGDAEFEAPQPIRINCDMTGGSSGGGWVADDDYVASVTSYGYECNILGCPEPNRLFGPYFGDTVQDLYKQARGKKLRCAGVEVTNLGTGDADDFDGTDGQDAFKLRGLGDSADARAGRDRACGGKGRDHLAGGDGDDELKGGKGKDVLNGGPGFDICKGGKGRDKARHCEERRKIRN